MTLRNKIKNLNNSIKNKIIDFEHPILDIEIDSKSNKDFLIDLNKIELTAEQKMILGTLLVN